MHAWLVDFHFIAAVKPTGIPDILTLVSSVSLYFSLYSKTNTTTSQPQPSQVRSGQSCSATARANLGEELQSTKMHLSHCIANIASMLYA